MFPDFLVHHIEGSSQNREEQIQAMVVREGKVLLVVTDALAIELQYGHALLDASGGVVDVLAIVELRWSIAQHPGVHEEGSATALVHPANNRVRLGHSLIIAEADSGPGLGVRRLDVPTHLVTLAGGLPAGVVLAGVLLRRAVRRVLPVAVAVVVQDIRA